MSDEFSSKDKYTAIVAFSTPSGPLHVGHALGYVAASTTSLFESLKSGREIFFPFGVHSTGKDLLRIVDSLQKGVEPSRYGLTDTQVQNILSATDPIDVLLHEFTDSYADDLESLGIALDKDSYFSTHHKIYEPFLHWTLKHLQNKGLIVSTESFRPYCTLCDEVKSIQADQSEALAVGPVNWRDVRVENYTLVGGNFVCKAHPDESLVVRKTTELAIDYGNKESQQKTKELIKSTLKTFPHSYKKDLEGIIDTRKEKPFERKAETNSGTASPFNPDKKVEALSDSNIYMEFYGLMKALRTGVLTEDQFAPAVFDYIFRNEGDKIAIEQQYAINDIDKIKSFVYSHSSVDLSVAGSEHKEVHFPFSLFTHANVLDKNFFPKELILTSNVMRNGEKMSKSKGNVLFLKDIVKKTVERGLPPLKPFAAADAIRYYLLVGQSLDNDFDWDDKLFETVGYNRMKKYANFVSHVLSSTPSNTVSVYDGWLATKTALGIQKGMDFYSARNFRSAFIEGFDSLFNTLSKYKSLVGEIITPLLQTSVLKQLEFAKPVIPRIADGLYSLYAGKPINHLPTTADLLIDMESHDKWEHDFHGPKFIQPVVGFINAKVGQLRGRKLLDGSSQLQINVSSNYLKDALEPILKERPGALQGINYSFHVTQEPSLAVKYGNITLR